ncbi:hypothetical protein EYF80_046298 [Liparis tanakae]|uniref:Uncharacterized protein n=1 Tax=Liparis tanakae TaxID=230148 RepID=A0A4Z2FRM6_9TELE|nr:hypothetical protein EYF80_046298 [Liparis tanakae]
MLDRFRFSLVMGIRTTPTTSTISPMDSSTGPRMVVTFLQWPANHRPLMMMPHARKLPPVVMMWMAYQNSAHKPRDASAVHTDSLRDRLNTVLSVRLGGVSWSRDWDRRNPSIPSSPSPIVGGQSVMLPPGRGASPVPRGSPQTPRTT